MTIDTTRVTMMSYFNAQHGDMSMFAEDVVFKLMSTGQEYHGRDGVLGMLDGLYNAAFHATAIPRVTLFGENNAMLEAEFSGKHMGEFMGIPATGKEVRVPLCVVYDLADGQIQAGRIYFETRVLLQQLGVPVE